MIRLTTVVAVSLVAVVSVALPVSAITLHQPGYTATPLIALPTSYYSPSDIELDGSGNLFIPTQTDGIQRISPSGVLSLWSTAPAIDLTLTALGDGYGAGRALCHCVLAIDADGSYTTLHSDSFDWTYVKLAPEGTLYASIWAGPGEGLYRIDRSTGEPTNVVAGGPGPGGSGWYWDMGFGVDGNLYTLGFDGTTYGLLRLDGAQFTRVVDLPHAGIDLTRDPSGTFYTATSFYDFGEVWIVDPSQGTATLLASDLAAPAGVAYDPSSGRLYVSEQSGDRRVWVITRDLVVATHHMTWGALKARYR